MSVDPTKPHFIPSRWKSVIAEHILRTTGKLEAELSASDFHADSSIHLRFEDKSEAIYRHAFCLHSDELNEIAIFTEHCGYYFYPKDLVDVEQLRVTPDG